MTDEQLIHCYRPSISSRPIKPVAQKNLSQEKMTEVLTRRGTVCEVHRLCACEVGALFAARDSAPLGRFCLAAQMIQFLGACNLKPSILGNHLFQQKFR